MKTQRNTCKTRMKPLSRLLVGLVALVVYGSGCTSAAHAQVFKQDQPTVPVESAVHVPVTTPVDLADLPSMDLSNMSRAWWKAVRKDHVRLLGSTDAQLKEQALKNLIFFAKMYRDQIDLTRAVPKLYKVYQRDQNESYRIMALSALGLIGNRNVMELLRDNVSTEKSERVRRLTLYVLADYYKNQGGP